MCLRSACLVLASPPNSLPSPQQTACLRCYVHAAGAVAAYSFVPLVSDDSENIIVAGQIFLVASCTRELCCGRFSAVGAQRRATVSGLFAGRLCRLNLHFWRVLCCPEPVLTLIRGERPHAQVEWRSRDESFGFSVGTMRRLPESSLCIHHVPTALLRWPAFSVRRSCLPCMLEVHGVQVSRSPHL